MCVGDSVPVIGKKSWILLEKLEKMKKISEKTNGGPPELEAWPPIRDGPPFFGRHKNCYYNSSDLAYYQKPETPPV